MDYSPDVKAFLDEREKEEKPSSLPDFHPIRVRLQGKGSKGGNDGKFVSRDFDSTTGKYQEEDSLFGPAPHDKWGGSILKVLYQYETKFNPNQQNLGYKVCTQEFEDFRTDPIDLSKITFGEKAKVELLQSFVNWKDFKLKTDLIDPMTHEVVGSPYSLTALIYVYNSTFDRIVRFVAKGSTRGAWFDYDKSFQKQLPEAKTLKQVKTLFGVKSEKNDAGVEYFVGTMEAHSLCTNEEMGKVVKAWNEVETWHQAMKSRRSVPVATQTVSQVTHVENLPVIDLTELPTVDHGMGEEIDLNEIPF